MEVQGRLKRRTHLVSLISVDVGVCQRCRARDVEPPTILPTMSTRYVPQRGRLDHGKLRYAYMDMGSIRAHLISPVVVNVAVNQRRFAGDADATTLYR